MIASATWCLFLWGIGIFLTKIFFDLPRWQLFLPAAVFLPCAIICLYTAIKKRPDANTILAILDSKHNCGGLLMAQAEADLNGWDISKNAEKMTLKFHPKPSKANKAALLGLIFLLVCFAMPKRAITATDNDIDVSNQADEIASQIDLLEDLEILEEPQAEELREELTDVIEESQSDKPEQTFDALDNLQNSLENQANQAVNELQAASEALTNTEAMAKALSESSDSISKENMAKAMEKLSQMAQSACNQYKQCPGADSSCAKNINTQNLSPQQLAELCKQLSQCNGQLSQCMDELIDAELCEGGCKKCCSGLSEQDMQALKAMLCEGEGENMGDAFNCMKPGRGGITRGPGHAQMSWKDPSSSDNTEFKAKQLTSDMSNLKDSQLIGMSVGKPNELKAAPQAGGSLAAPASGGASYGKRKLLPKHKNIVQNFFQPAEKKGKPGSKPE